MRADQPQHRNRHASGTGRRNRSLGIMALEPRLMFDGAAVATAAAAVADHHADPAAHAAPDAAAKATIPQVAAPTEVRAADPAQDGGKKEVAFVDTSIDNYKALEAGIKAGVEIVEISGGQSGLAQMAAWAETHSGYDTIHVFSHGTEGSFRVGSDTITDATLQTTTTQAELAEIGSALKAGGDIMLYGCDVANGADGQKFINDLSSGTGATVYASTDATGSSALGGDWVLEAKSTTVASDHSDADKALAVTDYSGLLAAPTTGTNDFSQFSGTVLLASNGASPRSYDDTNNGFTYTGVSSGNMTINAVSLAGYSEVLQYIAAGGTTWTYSSLKSTDSSDFKITSIKVGTSTATFLNQTWTVTGYKDGVAVYGATKTFTMTTSNILQSVDLSANAFGNIDEIRITTTANTSGNLRIDDVVTAPAGPTVLTAPTLSAASNSGSTSDTITNVTTPVITGSGATTGAIVTLYDTDGVTVLGAGIADGSGNWSITTSTLAEGNHSLSATQTVGSDTSGISPPLSITIDTIGPAALATPVLSPASDSGSNNSDGATNITTPTVTGTAEANSTVTVNIDGSDVGTVTADGSGNWSYTVGSALSAGSHLVKAKSSDVAGNAGSYSNTLTVIVDTASPTNITPAAAILSTSAATNGATFTSLSATDATNISGYTDSFTYSIAGGTDAGKFSISGSNLVINNTGGLTAGSYDVQIQVVDKVGNSYTKSLTLTVADGPSFTSGSTASIAENSATSTTVYQAQATPNSGSVSYALSGTDASAFDFDTSTGILTFKASPNFEAKSSYSVTITATDSIGSTPQAVTISITDVNEAPTGGNSTVSGTQNTTYVFQTSDFTFSDPDTGSTPHSFGGVQLTALPAAGTLWLDANNDGINNDAALTASSSISAADIAAGKLKFTPANNGTGTGYASVSFKVSDGSLLAASANTITIDVAAVNQPPVLTAGSSSAAYTEGGSAVAIDATLTVTDSDSTTMSGATAVISGGFVTGDRLNFTSQNGISATWNAGTQTLTLTGTASVANYQAALRSITFDSTSHDPGNGTRTVTWRIDDGAAQNHQSNQPTSTVSVTPVNDAPTLTTTAATSPTYTEGGSAVSLFSGTAASTVEAGQKLTQITLTVSGLQDGSHETLTIDGTDVALTDGNSVTSTANTFSTVVNVVGGTATVTITHSGDFTATQAQTLIDGLTYRDTVTGITSGTRTVTLTQVKDDGGTASSGHDSTTLSTAATVTVQPINHAPSLTTTAATSPTFTEGGTATSLFSGTSIDIGTGDSSQNIHAITLTVSGLSDGTAEVLSVDGSNVTLTNGTSVTTTDNGFSVSVSVSSGTATVTITRSSDFTAAQAQTLVNGLAYKNTSSDPTAAARTVTLTRIQDSGGTSGGGVDSTTLSTSTSVTVVPVNTAPTLTTTAATSPSYTEGGSAVSLFSGTAASAVEAGQKLTQITLTVSGLQDGSHEILTVDGTAVALTDGNSVTSSANTFVATVNVVSGTATVTITRSGDFTAAQAQTLINGLTYRDSGTVADITSGNRVITLTQVKDDGGTANSGHDSTTLSTAATVAVHTLNHAPTLTTTAATSPTFTEDGTAASLFSGTTIGLGAGDSGQNIHAITLTVSGLSDGSAEVLRVDGSNVSLTNGNSVTTTANGFSVTVSVTSGTATVTITHSGDFTTAQAQTLVNGLAYKNTSNDPTVATRTVTLTGIQDTGGTSGGGVDSTTLSTSTSVTVVPVNNAPTLDATTTLPSLDLVNVQTAALFSGASAGTVEAGQVLTSLTVTVTGLHDGGNEVITADGSAIALANGISGTSTGGGAFSYSVSVSGSTATITFTRAGNMTGAQVVSLVDSLTYKNISATATGGNRTVTLSALQDNGGTDNDGHDTNNPSLTSTILVVANDVPTISAPSLITSSDKSPKAISGVSISDTTGAATYTVTVSTSSATGQIHLTGVTAIAGANDSASITFQGSKSAINAALGTLKYTPGGVGVDAVSITVNDGGSSYIGGAKSATTSITFVTSAPSTTSVLAPSQPATQPGAPTVVTTPTTTSASDTLRTVVRTEAPQTGFVSITPTISVPPVAASNEGRSSTGNAAPASGLTLTAPAPSSFQVAVIPKSAGSADNLVVNIPIADSAFSTGSLVKVTVPTDAFANTNARAVVSLSATRADGASLPGWLSFNPQTGTFQGAPPPGFQGVVTVRVVARDNQGHEATQVFRIAVGVNNAGRAPADQGQGERGQPQTPAPRGNTGRTGGLLSPSVDHTAQGGRLGLTEQLAQMTFKAGMARQAAMFTATKRDKVA